MGKFTELLIFKILKDQNRYNIINVHIIYMNKTTISIDIGEGCLHSTIYAISIYKSDLIIKFIQIYYFLQSLSQN